MMPIGSRWGRACIDGKRSLLVTGLCRHVLAFATIEIIEIVEFNEIKVNNIEIDSALKVLVSLVLVPLHDRQKIIKIGSLITKNIDKEIISWLQEEDLNDLIEIFTNKYLKSFNL